MHLWDSLTGGDKASVLHAWTGRSFETSAWTDILATAGAMAVGLRGLGVVPGARVAAVLTNSADAVAGILGVWLAGGVLVSLPLAARGMNTAEYGRQLAALCTRIEAPLVVTDERVAATLSDALSPLPVRTWTSLPAPGRIDPRPPELDEVAFIQYSSGSTGTPKGCMLTPRAIASQLEILAHMSASTPGRESVACWMPLSHDMGVFGCLLYALAWDFDLILSTPDRFTRAPRSWFRDCADFRATLTVGTNTALHYASRFGGGNRFSRPLELRGCVIGAERIEWSTLTAAVDAFGPFGLKPEVFMPAYGLAEATLAVSAIASGAAPTFITVDTAALSGGEISEVADDQAGATRLVSVGKPCAGVEVRTAVPDRVAEIHVRSPSLASGYFGDPERTRARFVDGALHTGDLGFIRDGELYIVGRSDDVFCINGRNIHAHEIESTVAALEIVRSGCCTIVDLAGPSSPRLVMLLELTRRVVDHGAVAATAARIATEKAGVTLHECLFLPKGALPKTPSSKVQRFRCRQMLATGGFTPVARIILQDPA